MARPQLRVICPLVKNVTPHRRTRSHLDCREESFIASHVVSAYVSVVQVHASNFRYGRIRMQVYIATSIAFLAFSSSFWHVLSASLSFFLTLLESFLLFLTEQQSLVPSPYVSFIVDEFERINGN